MKQKKTKCTNAAELEQKHTAASLANDEGDAIFFHLLDDLLSEMHHRKRGEFGWGERGRVRRTTWRCWRRWRRHGCMKPSFSHGASSSLCDNEASGEKLIKVGMLPPFPFIYEWPIALKLLPTKVLSHLRAQTRHFLSE